MKNAFVSSVGTILPQEVAAPFLGTAIVDFIEVLSGHLGNYRQNITLLCRFDPWRSRGICSGCVPPRIVHHIPAVKKPEAYSGVLDLGHVVGRAGNVDVYVGGYDPVGSAVRQEFLNDEG